MIKLWAARCWVGIAAGEIVVSLVQNLQTGPGAQPAIQLLMGVSRMWIGSYDGMDIYSSLGDRTTTIVLLVRSVGSQKRRLKILKYISEKQIL